MSPSSLFIAIAKHIQFILGLLGPSWLTYIVNQLFSFCPVLGITQRTNISWERVGTIALLQLSAFCINMNYIWNCINCKHRGRCSTGTNRLRFLELPGGKTMCPHISKHLCASTQRYREQGVAFQPKRKAGRAAQV